MCPKSVHNMGVQIWSFACAIEAKKVKCCAKYVDCIIRILDWDIFSTLFAYSLAFMNTVNAAEEIDCNDELGLLFYYIFYCK